jgi:anion-transporting  ArsA/GET3 family ATPase
VVVCAGSGGVGKTTCAAALGVRAAQLGRRTLVLTVDPAQRLATALGLNPKDISEHPVQLSQVKGSLSAAVIDSKIVFDGFIQRFAAKGEIVGRIMKNRLYQQLSTTLAGSQEFTALERLLQAAESGLYDLVILDTPPTKHAVDFLTAPQRINALFQDGITRWFMSPSERSPGFFAGLVSRGTRMALKSLETLTGGPFIEELLDFFSAIRSIQKTLRERSEAAERLLLDAKTSFVVVTSFDAAKLLEAKYLQGELKRMGYRLKGVVINRAFPLGVPEHLQNTPPEVNAQVYERLMGFYKSFEDYFAFRYKLYESFAAELSEDVTIARVPEYQKDVHGIADLEVLAVVLGQGTTNSPAERGQ